MNKRLSELLNKEGNASLYIDGDIIKVENFILENKISISNLAQGLDNYDNLEEGVEAIKHCLKISATDVEKFKKSKSIYAGYIFSPQFIKDYSKNYRLFVGKHLSLSNPSRHAATQVLANFFNNCFMIVDASNMVRAVSHSKSKLELTKDYNEFFKPLKPMPLKDFYKVGARCDYFNTEDVILIDLDKGEMVKRDDAENHEKLIITKNIAISEIKKKQEAITELKATVEETKQAIYNSRITTTKTIWDDGDILLK